MTTSISNMNQTWLGNSNVYSAITMTVSTLGNQPHVASRMFKLVVDGNNKFDISPAGDVYVANTINTNTIIIRTGTITTVTSTVIDTNTVTANVVTTDALVANTVRSPGVPAQFIYNRVDAKQTYTFPAYPSAVGNIISVLNTTITPRTTSSNVLVTMCLTYEVVHDTVFRLVRSTGGVDTDVGINVNDSNVWSGTWLTGYDADNASTPTTKTFMYMDNPATTSPVTYKLKILSSGAAAGTFYLNRSIVSTGQASYEVGISQVFLQEIPT